MKNLSCLCFSLLILVGLSSCTPPKGQARQSLRSLPQRYELIQKFRESRHMKVIYQGETEASTQEWEGYLKRLMENMPSWYSIEIQRADAISHDSAWTRQPVLLLGTPQGHPLINRIQHKLPIQLDADKISFGGNDFTDSLCSLSLNFIPHPLNSDMPLNIVTGLSEDAIQRKLQGPSQTDFSVRLWNSYGYEINRGTERLMLGLFGENWNFDPERNWSFIGEDSYVIDGPVFNLKTHGFDLAKNERARLKADIERRWAEIQAFFDTTLLPKPFDLHLYKDAELMGMQRRKMLQGYVEFSKNQAHGIYHPALERQTYEPYNYLLVAQILGQELPPFLAEGMAHYFTPDWQGGGVIQWGLRLRRAGGLLAPEDMWEDKNFDSRSIYVRGATAGAFVHFLVEKKKDLLLSALQKPDQAGQMLAPTYRDFLTYLDSFPPEKKKAISPRIPFMRGMTLAHEGYNVYDGYGSHLADEALSKIKSLEGNAVALVPYSGSRNTKKPVRFRFWEGAGGENSMSLVFARHYSKEKGMSCLLKPQIYYGGAWPGAVDMEDPGDWDQWHEYYKEWITHYALLAAMFDFEYFCVGVEFVHATLENPEKWRQLIRDLRQIYQGPMTYAANWGEEAEKIAFADQLDFLGVNSYYPLSDKDSPSDQDLLEGAQKIADRMQALSERTKKSIIFTEVGFRSVVAPWQNPHAEPQDREVSNEDQAGCYRALLQAVDGKPWLKGMYWWKWPSYLTYAKRVPKSFTPCGKEAEGVLKSYYDKWRESE